MKIVESMAAMQRLSAKWVKSGEKIGFVPTMGALHEGHLTLIRRARKECGRVVVSIYVNPTQFGPKEDLAKYPRPRARDLALCRKEGVELVFAPTNLYLPDHSTYVIEEQMSQGRDGASRPGHFRGVATVVLKLFNLVRPTRAYFGQKDAQQVDVIQRMVRDLDVPVQIVVVPIVRDFDGVALSSRNVYLSPEERKVAVEFAKCLQVASKRPGDCVPWLNLKLKSVPGLKVDYVSLVGNRLCVSVFVGKTRLIDNQRLEVFDLPHHWAWPVQTLSGHNVTYVFTWNLPWEKRMDTGLGELSGSACINGQVFTKNRDVKALKQKLDAFKARAKGKGRPQWRLQVSEDGLEHLIKIEGLPELRLKIGKENRGFVFLGAEKIGRTQIHPEDPADQPRS